MDDKKSPSKPKPTPATYQQLWDHYHSQLDAYNSAVRETQDEKRHAELLMEPLQADGLGPETKEDLVELIRRQNHRLGRHIKARSHELLLEKLKADDGTLLLADGRYTVGHTYQAILDKLACEFPEASTSVACLRWYVVHMRSEARDEGKPWPDLPQKRPRSSKKKAAA
jgi:hypothetical protein